MTRALPGASLIESLSAHASPGGPTIKSVYEGFRSEILADLRKALPVDVVLLNSVEFWTGTNPALAGTQRTFRGENGEVAVVSYGVDGTMDLWITKTDGSGQFVRLARDSNSILVVDGDGNRLARVGDLNGRPALLPD